ncbi:MAG TPA: NADH-quinone oxidoreductase subunit N [Candidatus Didemnitutus sp.]|jgi:NADH-quinone oxidoreductase subunit N
MSPANLITIAESNHWEAIIPELMLACGALLLLVGEMLLPKEQQRYIPHLAALIQAAALLGVALNFDSPSNWSHQMLFGGLIRLTPASQIARVFFLATSLLVTFLAGVCLPRQRVPRIEFYHLVMVITAAMMLLTESDHFVMFFVALEALTIGFYILVSYYREAPLTLEAGLKYLVTGSLSSGILLFGIVLLYGAVGRVMDYSGTPHTGFEFATAASFLEHQPDNFLALVGVLLILSGVAFKIGAFPFQVWIPDVYQGAPTPVTAFLAVSSKAAGFAVLLILVQNVFAPLHGLLVPVLSAMAAATIIFGNLSALSQRNAKRLMGMSGVSHAGFLLVGVTASLTVSWAANAVWFYLFTYMLASMAVFGVMAHVVGTDDANQELDSYDQLARQRPILAAVLAIGVGSLAGIPPLAGFIGKLLVFIAAYEAHLYGLLAVAIAGVVMSIYYYFGWIKSAYFATWQPRSADAPAAPERRSPTFLSALILGGLALATILIGLWQTPITSWLPIK